MQGGMGGDYQAQAYNYFVSVVLRLTRLSDPRHITISGRYEEDVILDGGWRGIVRVFIHPLLCRYVC
jgi:hypothetical protein